jgi:hypothetical protein
MLGPVTKIYCGNSTSCSEICRYLHCILWLCLHEWMSSNYSAYVGTYAVKLPSLAPGRIAFLSFQPHYGPGVDSASIRNEYQEYFLGVKATGA